MSRLRLDLWGVACALLALAVFLVRGFGGALTRDLALYTYAGQQVLNGEPPYVGVLNRAGPLAHLLPAVGVLGARLVGADGTGDDVIGARVLMMLFSIGCVWGLYLLGRDVFRSRLAGVATAVATLTFQGFLIYATGGPREKSAMMFFVIVALLAIHHRRWATSGAFIALATLAWQPAFTLGVAAALAGAAAIEGRRWWRALLRFAGGGLLVSAVCVLVFVIWGALPALIEGFISINASYTEQEGLLDHVIPDRLELITVGFGDSFWLVVTGLGLCWLVTLLQALPAVRRREVAGPALYAVAAGGVGVTLWSMRAFNGYGDLVVFLPVAAVGFGAAVSLIRRVLLPRAPRVALGVSFALIGAGIVVAFWTAQSTRVDYFYQQREDVDEVFAIVPDATVVSIGGPQPLAMTGRTNPFRHQMFLTGLNYYVDDTYPGGLAGFAADIEEEQPTFITMDEPRWYGWLRPELHEHYTLLGESPQWFWYVRDDVDPTTVAELRAALED